MTDFSEAGVIDFVLHIPSDVNPYKATVNLLQEAIQVSESCWLITSGGRKDVFLTLRVTIFEPSLPSIMSDWLKPLRGARWSATWCKHFCNHFPPQHTGLSHGPSTSWLHRRPQMLGQILEKYRSWLTRMCWVPVGCGVKLSYFLFVKWRQKGFTSFNSTHVSTRRLRPEPRIGYFARVLFISCMPIKSISVLFVVGLLRVDLPNMIACTFLAYSTRESQAVSVFTSPREYTHLTSLDVNISGDCRFGPQTKDPDAPRWPNIGSFSLFDQIHVYLPQWMVSDKHFSSPWENNYYFWVWLVAHLNVKV